MKLRNGMEINDIAILMKKLIEFPTMESFNEFKNSLKTINQKTFSLHKSKVKSIKKIGKANNEYVYDIGMKNNKNPWFFGNNMLLHNSSFFSAYPILKNEIDNGEIEWNKETITDLYNNIAKEVSDTFPEFLKNKLNVPISRSTGVISSSRETISESGIWIVKKRYACLMFDKDGIRYDIDGKPGKVKAMGLDLKRADTPKFIQVFLSEILLDTLTNKGEDFVIEKIRQFKKKFEDMKPWQQGTPRAVNKLSYYKEKLEEAGHKKMKGIDPGILRIPGHVTASLAWNRMKEINQDQHSMKIIDGQKIVVCKLKPNNDYNINSIAYPVDETRLPNWFTSLPFDSEDMMAGVLDKKIENLLGVLKWDLKAASGDYDMFNSLFG